MEWNLLMPLGIKPTDYGLMMGGLALMQSGDPTQALQTGLKAYNTSALNQANQSRIAWQNALAQHQIMDYQNKQRASMRQMDAREQEKQRLVDLGHDPTYLDYVLNNPDLAKQFYNNLRADQERGRKAAELVTANPEAFSLHHETSPGVSQSTTPATSPVAGQSTTPGTVTTSNQPIIPETVTTSNQPITPETATATATATATTAGEPRDLGFIYENDNLVDQTIQVSPQLLAEGNQAALKIFDNEIKRIEKEKQINPQGGINDARDLLSLSVNPELQTGPVLGSRRFQAAQGIAHDVGLANIAPENRYVELTNTLSLKKLAGTDTGRKALTGAISDKELQFIIDSVPNLRSSKQYIAEYAARTMWASENLKRSRQIDIALRNKQITPEEAKAERAKIVREPSEQMKNDLKKLIAASQGEGDKASLYQGEGGQQKLINDIKNIQTIYMNHGNR